MSDITITFTEGEAAALLAAAILPVMAHEIQGASKPRSIKALESATEKLTKAYLPSEGYHVNNHT